MPTLGYFNLIVELLNNSYFLTKISKLKLYEDLNSVLLFPSDSWITMGFVFKMSWILDVFIQHTERKLCALWQWLRCLMWLLMLVRGVALADGLGLLLSPQNCVFLKESWRINFGNCGLYQVFMQASWKLDFIDIFPTPRTPTHTHTHCADDIGGKWNTWLHV